MRRPFLWCRARRLSMDRRATDWFMEQDSAVQESILGKGHYEAWRLGKFDLPDLVSVRPNVTWGDSLAVTPLRELT